MYLREYARAADAYLHGSTGEQQLQCAQPARNAVMQHSAFEPRKRSGSREVRQPLLALGVR